MAEFKVGQQVWVVSAICKVYEGTVISMKGDTAVVDTNRPDESWVCVAPSYVKATEAEAHAEAVRRAHSIVNRAELARARAMQPDDTTQEYGPFDKGRAIVFFSDDWDGWVVDYSHPDDASNAVFPTPADAILAVIPEGDRV